MDEKEIQEEFDKLMKWKKVSLVELIINYEIDKIRKVNQVEALNDHIGSLQEKIELLHLDLATQIHWRLKLEEELKSGIQRN